MSEPRSSRLARRGRLLLAIAAAAAVAGGCAHRRPRPGVAEAVVTDAGSYLLVYELDDRAGGEMVRRALSAAGPRLARWGSLRDPVEVRVLPTHESLERAVGRPGYAWLRAWARREVVFVQSPPTWFEGGPTQPQVNELLLHELTHCVMYQAASPGDEWQRKGIPVWFREGMASVTANQGYRRASWASLARLLAGPPSEDPIAAPERLFRDESDAVYSAGHHAFAFLVRRYGDGAVRGILAEMYAGRDFEQAFEAAIGIRADAFIREFKRYVLMGGWRSSPPRFQRKGAHKCEPSSSASPVESKSSSSEK
ncbi:MAG: hypothetical protein ACOX6T_03300 [Myxococcales bacterium]|jgi:hypothetical protein